MANVAVTGGGGFIGSHLAQMLAREHEVVVVDNFDTGRRENLDGVDARLVEGSILDGALLDGAFEGCEAVFHQAALARVPRSVEFPVRSHEANATGTLQVLEAARRAGVRRVVYASSSSVYGDTDVLPTSEAVAVATRSPYAASKLAGESYCRAYTACYGLETVSLRYFNVYGPRQDPASKYGAAPANFASRLLAGTTPLVYGDGLQSRDFTFVGDAVSANLAAWRAPGAAVSGLAFNVGGGSPRTILDLLEIMRSLTGKHTEAEFGPTRTGDVRHTHADTSAFRAATTWKPETTLEDGCARLVQWLQDNPARIVAFAQ